MTFSSPMPDGNYVVTATLAGPFAGLLNAGGSTPFTIRVSSETSNGFDIAVVNADGSLAFTAQPVTFNWIAIEQN